jgi:hypothetical protein
MTDELSPISILAVDCGSVYTHAVLLDVVDGVYRMVARATAPTTAEPPVLNLAEGVRRAIMHIQTIIARPLLDEHGRLIVGGRHVTTGVDVCVLTASVADPLRLILAGLVEEFDLASARQAALTTYTRIEEVISLSDGRDMGGRIELLANRQADAVLVVGGTEGGANGAVQRLVKAALLAAQCRSGRIGPRPSPGLAEASSLPPTLLYAGNSALHAQLHDLINGHVPLVVTDNIRPRLDVERLQPLQSQLEALYEARQLAYVPGFDHISAWSTQPALPTARAFGRIVQFLSARQGGSRVLGVDVGSAATVVAFGDGGRLDLRVRADVGVGHSAARLLEAVSPADVARWLPFPLDPAEVHNFAWNKALYPATVPQEAREVALEQALAREAIRITLEGGGWETQDGGQSSLVRRPSSVIAAGSTLARAPRPGQTVLALLDAVQPVGIVRLLADVNGLMPALGAVGLIQPIAVVQVLEKGGLLSLGTAIVPSGSGVPGEPGLRLRLRHPAGGPLEVEVPYGELEVVPLPAGEEVPVALELASGLGLEGLEHGQVMVTGGAVGLIVDLRGRPLHLPDDPEACAAQAQAWLARVGG